MKQVNKINPVLILFFLLLATSCKKAATEIIEESGVKKVGIEVIEKTGLKEIGSEVIEKVTKNTATELSELGLSKEAREFVEKNFDDDLTKQFLKVASENKTFLTYAKSNPTFLNTWKTFSKTNFASNPNQIRWINSAIDNQKYSLNKVGERVELLDLKTKKLLGTFERDKITATAGGGYKDLNPFLNMRNKYPLLPNAKYEIKNGNSITYYHSDAFGRVDKMMCPLVSNNNKTLRSPIEQGLSKSLKDGRLLVDELGNPIKSKTGYVRSTDDGGHYLANSLNGISEQINMIPMSNEANKIYFKKIEIELSKAISNGKLVKEFTVISKYPGKIRRPNKFIVSYYIDGVYFRKNIMNL